MSLPNITTVFFSGTYEEIVSIPNKSLGSFYYAQDKDAWYTYFGSPHGSLQRVSDVYSLDTEAQRVLLTADKLFDKKLYVIKETGIVWWNETGNTNDWIPIGIQSTLRDVDEDLVGIDKSKKGYNKFYSTEKLREAVKKAYDAADKSWIQEHIDRIDNELLTERTERISEDTKLQKQINDNHTEINNKVDQAVTELDDKINTEKEDRIKDIADLTKDVDDKYNELKELIEQETQARLSSIIELNTTITNAKNELIIMIETETADRIISIDDLKEWVINYIAQLKVIIDEEAEQQQLQNIEELTRIIEQYVSELETMITNEIVDIGMEIHRLETLIERYNAEIRDIIDTQIEVAISSLVADLGDHIGSVGVTNHGIADGIQAGFSQANFTQSEKEKLALLSIEDNTLTGSTTIIVDVITKQIQRAALTGDVTAPVNSNVTSITNEAVTSSKLAENAVTTTKINNSAVTNTKLNNDAVTSEKIADDAVTTYKIADNAVTSDKLGNLSVSNMKLGNEAVTSEKIKNLAVESSKLANNAVTTEKMSDNAVSSQKIINNAVTTGKINDLAVNEDKIASEAVTSSKLADNAVTTHKIDNDAVISSKLADNAVTSDKIINNAVTTDKINNGAITPTKLSDNSVVTNKINNSAVTNVKLSDMTANTIKGRITSSGTPQDLTASQIRYMLNVNEGVTNYVHPTYDANNTVLTGKTIYSGITINTLGHVTGLVTRTLDISDMVVNSTSMIVVGNQLQRAALTGDVTVPQNSNVTTIAIGVVSNIKMASMLANRIKGTLSVDGPPQDLTPTQVRSMINVADGANNYVHPTHPNRNVASHTGRKIFSNIFINNEGHITGINERNLLGSDIIVDSTTNTVYENEIRRTALVGDVTAPANNNTLTISNKVVTNAKLMDVNTNTIKGRIASGSGSPEDLTPTQVRSILNIADGANNYVHPYIGNHSITASGRAVISEIFVNDNGHVVNMAARDLTPTNIIDDSTSITVFDNKLYRAAFTGDVVASENSNTLTISNKAVTNTKMNDMGANTLKGRITNAGTPQDLTPAQVRTMLSVPRLIGTGTAAPSSSLGENGDVYFQYV